MTADRLDSRTWLGWGIAMMVPLLITRNPWMVAELLAIVLTVRTVWADRLVTGWSWIARVAAILIAIGVVFNALTVRSGDRVLVMIPESVPVLDGPITLNAVVYGVVSGCAMLALILTGTTVAAGLRWSDLMRVMPPRVAPLAVSGSISWSFLPGSSRALREIRESQVSRGHGRTSARDLPGLVVPLLEGGLERAMTMSEALEARGFGAAAVPAGRSSAGLWTLLGLVSLVTGAYALALGSPVVAGGAAVGVVIAIVGSMRLAPPVRRTTRYRDLRLQRADWLVLGLATIALIAFLARTVLSPGSHVFNPYPTLTLPTADVVQLLALALLLWPAVLVARSEATP